MFISVYELTSKEMKLVDGLIKKENADLTDNPGRWDGKPIECQHRYAIAILIDQDWKTSAAFSGSAWISNSMSFLSYSTIDKQPLSIT